MTTHMPEDCCFRSTLFSFQLELNGLNGLDDIFIGWEIHLKKTKKNPTTPNDQKSERGNTVSKTCTYQPAISQPRQVAGRKLTPS